MKAISSFQFGYLLHQADFPSMIKAQTLATAGYAAMIIGAIFVSAEARSKDRPDAREGLQL